MHKRKWQAIKEKSCRVEGIKRILSMQKRMPCFSKYDAGLLIIACGIKSVLPKSIKETGFSIMAPACSL